MLSGAGERDGPLLAALALASDVAAGAENHVSAVEADQLGDAQPGLEGEHQQGTVPPAFPAPLVRGVDERGGFPGAEEAHGRLAEALGRDGQHPLDHSGVLGVAQGGVAEQGPDGREAKVAGPGAVVPFGLQVIQEGGDRLVVKVVPVEAGGGLPGSGVHEAHQQPERVPVGGNGAGAGLALTAQPVGEPRLERGGDRGHRIASWAASSRAAA